MLIERSRTTVIGIGAAILLALSGCGSDGTTTSDSATTPTVQIPGGTLTKAQFITAADALCAQSTARQNAVVAPQNEDDYPALIAEANFFLTNAEPFYDQLDALANRSPDAAQLRANWLDQGRANVAAATPIFEKLRSAAQLADPQTVRSATKQLTQLPTHGTELAKYLNSYGLTDCASLESN